MATRNLGEELLRLAVHASPSGILIVDAGGEIVFANAALLGMFDYELDELLAERERLNMDIQNILDKAKDQGLV